MLRVCVPGPLGGGARAFVLFSFVSAHLRFCHWPPPEVRPLQRREEKFLVPPTTSVSGSCKVGHCGRSFHWVASSSSTRSPLPPHTSATAPLIALSICVFDRYVPRFSCALSFGDTTGQLAFSFVYVEGLSLRFVVTFILVYG